MARSDVLEFWRSVADDARGLMIPNCAHYLQEEQPDAVVREILAFAAAIGIP